MVIKNISTVVAKNLCAKCGICYSICPAGAISITGYIDKKPVVNESCNNCGLCVKACPGLTPIADQDNYNLLGFAKSYFVGYSTDEIIRSTSSSGGLITSLCTSLLNDKKFDGVICTRQHGSDILDNEVILAKTRHDILSARGSRYAPAFVCRGLKDLKLKDGGSYVFVGKPCDIQALTKYQKTIKKYDFLKIALFCAHTPKMSATKEIIDNSGIKFGDISRLRYRGDGWPGYFTLLSKDNTILYREEYIKIWSTVLCKSKNRNKRCLLCHDCTGESADLSFGDAWLDKYTGTSPGHSVVIARNERAEALLELATRNGDIHLENVGPETVIESQKSLLLKKRNRYLCRLANQILFEKLPEETVGFDRSMNDVIKIFGLIKQFALIKFGI
ncbi:MAG: Coenzyme F420 hydrogenase/dehydrogenase, beta subunit C-terminal domain [Spirochaetes bacterium]|nr:Coenzyme F420 hydrogenase/dehydrogenase, beta subunit C-terminal domain [Spirochaetota bacterium]